VPGDGRADRLKPALPIGFGPKREFEAHRKETKT